MNGVQTMKCGQIPAVLFLVGAAAAIGAATEEAPVLAPGWGELEYELPQPGTYNLPVIHTGGGGAVLKSDGEAADLRDFLRGKITVLSFIYTSCDDVNGCPLSIFVLHRLQDRLKHEPEIAARLRLISFSFDPEKDTPEVLSEYEKEHGGSHDGGAEWMFMVTASERALAPVLKSYSQFVIPEFDESSKNTGKFSHLLRVFLIDGRGRVRNIYSPDFLHPDILLADVKSLLLMDDQG